MFNKILYSVLWVINTQLFVFLFFIGWFSLPLWYSFEAWVLSIPIIVAVGLFSKFATDYLEDAGFLRRVNN